MLDKNSYYLPVGENEFNWGLYLTIAGYSKVLPYENFPNKNHPAVYQFQSAEGRILSEYQIILIIGGEGSFSSGSFIDARVSQGDVIMLFPGVWHTYSPSRKLGWEDYWVGLNGSWLTAICKRNLFTPEKPLFHLDESSFIQMKNTFAELFDSVKKNSAVNSPDYIVSTMKILTLLNKESKVQIPSFVNGKEKIVQEAVRVIWQWSYRRLTVEDIARSVQINRRTLERYFRDVLGASVHDEIIRCRLVRAQQLLKNTQVPVQQIAGMTGFSSYQQMCFHFARLLNSTPKNIRGIK